MRLPLALTVAIAMSSFHTMAFAESPGEDALAAELPASLVSTVESKYGDDATRTRVLGLWLSSNEAFEKQWAAYQERAKEVQAALESIDPAKDPAGALRRIRELIEPEPELKDKYAPYRRHLIEARDAEFAALTAAVEAAKASRDYGALWSLKPAFASRRNVGEDKEQERLLWFGYRNRKDLQRLSAGEKPDFVKLVRETIKKAEDASREGGRIAFGFAERPDSLGLKPAEFVDPKAAKKGEWILAGAIAAKKKGRSVAVHYKKVARIPKNCRETDKVIGIEWSTGRFIFELKCDYDSRTTEYTVSAALRDPKASIPSTLVLAGRVVQAGPNWKLADAQILPMAHAGLTWEPGEYEFREPDGSLRIVGR